MNSVLCSLEEIDHAHQRLVDERFDVPQHASKCWDLWKAFIFITGSLKQNARILDAGTYSCRILEALYYRGFRRLYGCDLAPVERRRFIDPYLRNKNVRHMLLSLAGHGPIRLSRRNLVATAYPDRYFDCISSLSVIEHMADHGSFFREMGRILRRGGYIVISADYWREKVDTGHVQPYGLTWRIFDQQGIRALLDEARAHGFKLLEPIEFSCCEPVIVWNERRYTFIFFVLQLQ